MLSNSARIYSIFRSLSCSCQHASSASTVEDDFHMSDAKQQNKKLNSRLNERHRILAEGGIPPITYESEKEKWSLRERFAQFGLASGVDPRQLWPTVEEVEDMKNMRMYRKVKDAMKIGEEKKADDKEKYEARVKMIDFNLKNHQAELKEFEASLEVNEVELSEREKLKQKRIKEVQEYFGYYIDPRDPKFAIVLEQKELEEKKLAKKVKKEASDQKKRELLIEKSKA